MGLKEALLGKDKDSFLLEKLEEINDNLAKFAGEDYESLPALASQVVELKKQVAALDIEKSKREEEFSKREREIQHKIGLERKRSEFEREEAAKNAKIEVREENLINKQEAFDDNMKFMRERFEQEIAGWREMYKTVFDKVPTVNVDRRIREEIKHIEAGPDGNDVIDE